MSSFPAGKYTRYKRATAFFLDWLLRARRRGRYASKRMHLEMLSGVVREIAEDPSTLTPKLLQELPKALAACQCAITLRGHVATFFGDDDHGHRHFLGLLRGWLDTLKGLDVEEDEATSEPESATFESYCEVLQVDEDYFPDEDTVGRAEGLSKKANTDRKRLFDEAFEEDLRMEVVYFFLELEELVDGVFDAYSQVKKHQRTIVEATVVVQLAMDQARALTAQLQLKYSALKTADEVLTMVKEHIPKKAKKRIEHAVSAARQKFEDEKTFTPVHGMLLVISATFWTR